MIRAVRLVLASAMVLAVGNASASAVAKCDALAAHPTDPDRKAEGRLLENIPLRQATEACHKALDEEPGNPRLMYQYGRTLLAAKREEEGMAWTRKSAKAGYRQALYILGLVEQRKNPPELAKARDHFAQAARLGHPRSMALLGTLYLQGEGVSPDASEALVHYRRAADLGDELGQLWLGALYLDGIGVIRNPRTAAHWFTLAAEQDPLAMLFLGRMHQYGDGVGKDEAKAFKLIERSAHLGEESALAHLGACYFYGWGVERDENEAIRWLRQAAEKNDAYGVVLLGLALLGKEGDRAAIEEGLRLITDAAEMGDVFATERLWSIYYYGHGVAADEKKSTYWMEETERLRRLLGGTPRGEKPPLPRLLAPLG